MDKLHKITLIQERITNKYVLHEKWKLIKRNKKNTKSFKKYKEIKKNKAKHIRQKCKNRKETIREKDKNVNLAKWKMKKLYNKKKK